MEPDPSDKDDGEKYPHAAALSTIPTTLEAMQADFQRTWKKIETEHDKHYQNVGWSASAKRELSLAEMKRVGLAIQRGNTEQFMREVQNQDIDKIWFESKTGRKNTLLSSSITSHDTSAVLDLIKRGAKPCDHGIKQQLNIGNQAVTATTPLGISLLNQDVPAELASILLEVPEAQDSSIIGRIGFFYNIILCNLLGYDIPEAKKNLILALMNKRGRYEMLKRALLLSKIDDENNAIQTLLINGDFYYCHEFKLLMESSKKFLGKKTATDLVSYQKGLEEIGGALNDPNSILILIKYAGKDIFPKKATSNCVTC